ncbi:hypothetical protein MKEN_00613200 [Mycena kentingensis (nom. inval.)]|nr:hypothetical protein MKEN_00613200 [Mycena kentingensis (nom. inval.)]
MVCATTDQDRLAHKLICSHPTTTAATLTAPSQPSLGSSNIVSQISSTFKDDLGLLYTAAPAQTVAFAAAALSAITERKIRPEPDKNLRYAWEIVQKSIIGSVHDALENDSSATMKSAIADELYMTVRDLFYSNNEILNQTLRSNVNLMLSDSARDSPDNQSRLRSDKCLGPRRLSMAMAQSRGYFVLESVLDLIGVLLPDRKLALSKRNVFVDALFPATVFGCSQSIKALLRESGTEWEPVAAQIIQTLADFDNSYPQPFHVTDLNATPQELPHVVNPLYIDNNHFFVNYETGDGVVDSYQVPFLTLERISMSGSAAQANVTVTMLLNAPPTVGGVQARFLKDVNYTFSFALKSSDRGRFMKTLQQRGLKDKIGDAAERKISLLVDGSVSLEYPTSVQLPTTQKERIEKVEQLWKDDDPDLEDESGTGPTSPLVNSDLKARLRTPTPPPAAAAPTSNLSRELFEGDLSELEEPEVPKSRARAANADTKPKPKPKPKPKATANKARPEIAFASGLPASPSPPPVKRKARKTAAPMRVESATEDEDGDEAAEMTHRPPSRAANLVEREKVLVPSSSGPGRDDDDGDGDFEPSQQPKKNPDISARSTRRTRGGAKKSVAVVQEDKDDELPKAVTEKKKERVPPKKVVGESKTVEEDEPPRLAKKKGADVEAQNKDTNDTLAEPKTRGKRTRAAAEDKEERNAVVEDSEPEADPVAVPAPAKRQRRLPDGADDSSTAVRRDSAAVFGTATVPLPAKRYGKKAGRTSSPERAAPSGGDDMDVDFDELPSAAPKPPPKTKAKAQAKEPVETEQEAEPRTRRVAAMKGKGGQATAPAPANKAKVKAEKKPATKRKAVVEVELDEEVAEKKPATKPNTVVETEFDVDPPVKVEKPSKLKKVITGVDDVASTNKVELKTEAVVEVKQSAKRRSAIIAKDNALVAMSEEEVPKSAGAATSPLVAEKSSDVAVEKPKVKPKPKPLKPKKAPWEDMHLRKSDEIQPVSQDVVMNQSEPMEIEPVAVFEEYYEPVKGSDVASDPVEPPSDIQDQFSMAVDPIEPALSMPPPEDVVPPAPPSPVVAPPSPVAVPVIRPVVPRSVAVPPPAAVSSSRLPLTNIPAAVSTPPVTRVQKSQLPVPVANLPTPPKAAAKQHYIATPQMESEPVAPPPVAKLPSLFRQPSPLKDVVQKSPHRVQRRFETSKQDESPFPERTRHSVTFADSPSPVVVDPGYAPRGRTSHRYAPYEKEKVRESKRSKSPMSEMVHILNEINEIVLQRISQRFESVRHDVRVGRDNILRDTAANLERNCVQCEKHFNILVDIEDEYATYHRKIIAGFQDMQQTTAIMSKALGQVIQQHDRRTLAKKIPPTLFSLPSVVRNPVVL